MSILFQTKNKVKQINFTDKFLVILVNFVQNALSLSKKC